MDDLQLELALSNQNLGDLNSNKKKRTFHDLFSDHDDDKSCSNKRTLPLFDNHNVDSAITDRESRSRCVDVEEEVVVGWPPVKPRMKKLAEQRRRESTASNYITVDNVGGGGSNSSSMYVKVEMEGIGIARKIDLRLHRSYETLTPTLIAMFGKRLENLKMYNLTYQDNEGDWLLAGDVPWPSFVESVRRLKLLRKER